MRNFRISVRTVDGGVQDVTEDSGKELIHQLVSNDWAAPPTALEIVATTDDGQKVRITVPYTDDDRVSVSIESPEDVS